MSNLTLRGNVSGTGTFIVESPNSNTNRTITLPDATTTLVGTDTTQTLTNKTLNGGALTLMTAQASTSGTFIDFTGIPSWAKRVTVLLNGVSTNGTSLPLVRIGAGSFLTTGYANNVTQTANGTATSATASASTFGFYLWNSSWAAVNDLQGFLTFINLTGNTWVASGTVGSAQTAVSVATSGSIALGGALDRIRITTVNGTDTFDNGTVNVMYEG